MFATITDFPSFRQMAPGLSLALFLLVFASCGWHTSGTSGGTITSTGGPRPAGATDTASAGKIKIKTPDDQTVVEFKPGGENVKIEFTTSGQAKVLHGDIRDSGKRKYTLEGGSMVAEVKPGDDGFKVRTPDGRLLWKVKISEGKIKISNNEENKNPFVLSIKENDRVKILRDETEIGAVKFYRDRQRVEVKDTAQKELYQSNTDRYSAMYGVLMMDQIPDAERYIIMAEILGRSL